MSSQFKPAFHLEYDLRFSWRRAVELCVTTASLIAAITWLNSESYFLLGIGAAMLTVRLVMGSPMEEQYTQESLAKITEEVHKVASTILKDDDTTPPTT